MEASRPKRGKSAAFLLLAASCWVGIFTMWSFEYAIAVPYFTSVLGFSAEIGNLMWVAGPISGLFVGPVVGALSDGCRSSFGRRRPFILGGLCFTLLSAILFAGAPYISGKDRPQLARVLAGVGFCTMDLAINTIQNPARALLSDIAAEDQQVLAQTLTALLCGFGYMIGYLIVYSTPYLLSNIVRVYVYGGTIFIFTTCITLVVAKEKAAMEPALPEELAAHVRGVQSIMTSATGFVAKAKAMPSSVRWIAACQAFCWFGWFCFSQIITQFFGTVVYSGVPDAKCFVSGELCQLPSCDACDFRDASTDCDMLCRYEVGVQEGSLGLLCQNIVTMCASFALSVLQKRFEARWLYRVTLGLQALIFLLLALKHDNSKLALGLVALTGFAQAGTQVFPYALMGLTVSDPNLKGLAMGLLTLCIVIPQFIDTTYVGLLGEKFGLDCVIFLGGCYAFLACIATYRLPKSHRKDSMHTNLLEG